MKPLATVALALTCTTVVALAAPAQAATPTRPVVTAGLSASLVLGALPVSAVVSVVQVCPKGSLLDASATRTIDGQIDAFADPHLRLASRELWAAGTVSRFRVIKAAGADDGVMVFTAALCRASVPVATKTVSGRAFSDLRVWGPAPADLNLLNITAAMVSDNVTMADHFATVMTAAGVSSSRGSLPKAVETLQQTALGLGAVAAIATTHQSVRRGQFVSMKNSYRYTSDLSRKVTARARR